MISQSILSTLRTDGNGTRFVNTKNVEEMKRLLLRLAADREVQSVKVELQNAKDDSIEIKLFIRHQNEPSNGAQEAKTEIGGLKEAGRVFVEKGAQLSLLTVLMGDTIVHKGSVVMGSRILENCTVDNADFYQDNPW